MVACVPILGFILTLAVVAGYICCTVTDYWFQYPNIHETWGLWRDCFTLFNGDCNDIGMKDQPAFLHIARGCMVGASFVGLVAIIITLVGLIQSFGATKVKIGGILIILSASAVATGTIWYAVERATNAVIDDYKFGYSIIIGWVTVPLAIIAGSMQLTAANRN